MMHNQILCIEPCCRGEAEGKMVPRRWLPTYVSYPHSCIILWGIYYLRRAIWSTIYDSNLREQFRTETIDLQIHHSMNLGTIRR